MLNIHHIFKDACTEQWLNFQLTAALWKLDYSLLSCGIQMILFLWWISQRGNKELWKVEGNDGRRWFVLKYGIKVCNWLTEKIDTCGVCGERVGCRKWVHHCFSEVSHRVSLTQSQSVSLRSRSFWFEMLQWSTGFEVSISQSQNVIYFPIIAMPKKSRFTIFAIQNLVQNTKNTSEFHLYCWDHVC